MLKIADKRSLPDDTVTSTLVVYGAKGMGKSHFGRKLAEGLYDNSNRFCFLDPVGANWGLRFGKNPKQAGLEILILGGARGDIPIEPTGGAVVADLVADETISTVIDISRHPTGKMWSKGEKIRFVADFCTRLYERQGERREPLMLIIDEAGRFCPQAIRHGDVEIAKCIGAIEELVELGRNVGIGVTLITQRSARMSKSVSELADCMVAFRTIGPNSIDAILGWLGEHIPKERWKDVLGHLRSLPRGSALMVSPGWLEFEGVVNIRDTRTFDSSETPKGNKRRVNPAKANVPDLKKYLERMRDTVERVKDNDPRALKAKIAELEKKLKETGKAQPKAVDVPVFDAKRFDEMRGVVVAHLTELNDIEDVIKNTFSKVDKAILGYRDDVKASVALGQRGTLPDMRSARRDVSRTIPSPAPAPETVRSESHPNGERKLRPVERKMLAALEKYGQKSLSQVALLIGSPLNSTLRNAVGYLRTQGLVDGSNDLLRITTAGQSSVGYVEPLPDDGEELLKHWCSKLRPVEAEMLKAWVNVYPKALSLESVASKIGSPFNSTVRNAVGRLRTLGLISGKNDSATANERLI